MKITFLGFENYKLITLLSVCKFTTTFCVVFVKSIVTKLHILTENKDTLPWLCLHVPHWIKETLKFKSSSDLVNSQIDKKNLSVMFELS